MEDVKKPMNAEQEKDVITNEMENFDVFIKAMAQIVEKYGKIVLQELDMVA